MNSNNDDGYRALAAAIIGGACSDYIIYKLETKRPSDYMDVNAEDDVRLRNIKANRKSRRMKAERNYISAVKFLDDNNGWFNLLTQGTTAKYLIEQMDKLIEERKKNKFNKGFQLPNKYT